MTSTHDELIIDVGKKQQKETTNVITNYVAGIWHHRTTENRSRVLISFSSRGLTVCVCVYDIHTQTHYTHKHGKKRGRRGVRAGGERASGESERKAEGT